MSNPFADHAEGTDLLVEIEYEHVLHVGDNAVLFSIEDREVWLPLELIQDWDEEAKTLRIPEWLAIDRELE